MIHVFYLYFNICKKELNMQTLMKANSLIDITTEDGCLVFEKQLCETNSNLINFPRNLYKFEENHVIEAL